MDLGTTSAMFRGDLHLAYIQSDNKFAELESYLRNNRGLDLNTEFTTIKDAREYIKDHETSYTVGTALQVEVTGTHQLVLHSLG